MIETNSTEEFFEPVNTARKLLLNFYWLSKLCVSKRRDLRTPPSAWFNCFLVLPIHNIHIINTELLLLESDYYTSVHLDIVIYLTVVLYRFATWIASIFMTIWWCTFPIISSYFFRFRKIDYIELKLKKEVQGYDLGSQASENTLNLVSQLLTEALKDRVSLVCPIRVCIKGKVISEHFCNFRKTSMA